MWLLALLGAILFPLVVTTPFFLSTATVAVMFVALAVAYDLVVGRVGALSLAQPLFLGIGAYSAAILSSQFGQVFVVEAAVAMAAAMILAFLIGIPAFRLNLHAFAIATLAFSVTGLLVAHNWIDVTRGALCITGIPALTIGVPPATVVVDSYAGMYWVILAIASGVVALILFITRRRLGLALTAVRDDDVLASARGLWPTELRILAFVVSAGLTGLVGAFLAHHQRVVCPTTLDLPVTVTLIIMVFMGGRGSLRGVVTAAVVFTAAPQILRLAAEWRLVIFGTLLLLVVTVFPDGIEQAFQALESRWRKLRARRGPETATGLGDD